VTSNNTNAMACEQGDHDWVWVESWLGQPAYYYCAVCGYSELAADVEPLRVTANTNG